MINARNLNRLSPGDCAFNINLYAGDIVNCLEDKAPCVTGKLAIVSAPDISTFEPTGRNIIDAAVACVPGSPSDCPNAIPVWDRKNAKLACVFAE
jgi:hypothetical protein